MTHLRHVTGEVLDPYMGTITQVVQLYRLQKLEVEFLLLFFFKHSLRSGRRFFDVLCSLIERRKRKTKPYAVGASSSLRAFPSRGP